MFNNIGKWQHSEKNSNTSFQRFSAVMPTSQHQDMCIVARVVSSGIQNISQQTQGCWCMLTPMLPRVVNVGWMSLGTILDTHGKLLRVKTQQHYIPVHLAPTTIPHSKALKYFCLAHSTSEWHTNKIHVSFVSRLKNPY
jgi:hypothetical protein